MTLGPINLWLRILYWPAGWSPCFCYLPGLLRHCYQIYIMSRYCIYTLVYFCFYHSLRIYVQRGMFFGFKFDCESDKTCIISLRLPANTTSPSTTACSCSFTTVKKAIIWCVVYRTFVYFSHTALFVHCCHVLAQYFADRSNRKFGETGYHRGLEVFSNILFKISFI